MTIHETPAIAQELESIPDQRLDRFTRDFLRLADIGMREDTFRKAVRGLFRQLFGVGL